MGRERPLLILDLDETLVWASKQEARESHDFRVFDYYVVRRPYVDEFLDRMFSWFEVAVWTSSQPDYAAAVVRELFGEPWRLRFVWTAERCTYRFDRHTADYYWLKDLNKVKRQGYSLDRILVIDDSPEKLQRQYGNHLQLSPFEGDPADQELLDVLPFLDWIRSQPDFRRIEKRDWRTRTLDDPPPCKRP